MLWPLSLLLNKASFISWFWTAMSLLGRKVNCSCLAKSACKTSVKFAHTSQRTFRSGSSTSQLSFILVADHSAALIKAGRSCQIKWPFQNNWHCQWNALPHHSVVLIFDWRSGSEGGTLVQQWALLPLSSYTDIQESSGFSELLAGMIVRGWFSLYIRPVIK